MLFITTNIIIKYNKKVKYYTSKLVIVISVIVSLEKNSTLNKEIMHNPRDNILQLNTKNHVDEVYSYIIHCQ
jgi:hypothetical protein